MFCSISCSKGTIIVDPSSGQTALASGSLPAPIIPIATAHSTVFDFIKTTLDTKCLKWTVITPPFMIVPGERTGHYSTGADNVEGSTMNITYADFAIAVVDEVEHEEYINKRIVVSN